MSSKDKKHRQIIKLGNLEKLIVNLTSKIEKQNNMIGILAKYLKNEKSKLDNFETELKKCKAEIDTVKLYKTTVEKNTTPNNEDIIMVLPDDKSDNKTQIVIVNDESETLKSSDSDDIYGWMKCNHVSQFENLFEECENL